MYFTSQKQNTASYHSPVESHFAHSRSFILLPITFQVCLWLSTELLKVTISLRLYLITSARYFQSYLALYISASTATIQSRLGSLIFAFISLYFSFLLFSLYSLIFTIYHFGYALFLQFHISAMFRPITYTFPRSA